MTFWLNADGKIVLNDDGKFALCDECPCDSIPCDTNSIPRTLYATFGGASDFLGTLTLTYTASPGYPGMVSDTVSGYWRSEAFTLACDAGIYFEIIFGCEPSNRYAYAYFLDAGGGKLVFSVLTVTSYDPILISGTATAGSGLGCPAGPHSVTITEVSP